MKKVYEILGTPKNGITFMVRVYRDSSWDEFRVRTYQNGKLLPEYDNFQQTREDAIGTADHIVKEWNNVG
jgi:hypothetical protein